MKKTQHILGIFLLISTILLTGCKKSEQLFSGLDKKYPITIQVWHYYNAAQKKAFDELINEFNETVGAEKGIIVEGHGQGTVNELEENVISAIQKEVGSEEAPNIFASYADTAFAVEQMGMLADLDDYFTKEEQEAYLESFLEEGKIGKSKQLKIFPTAKSTEVLMLNKTDWDKFSEATNVTLDSLKTKEGVAETAKLYYQWTDSLTADHKDDGKAFYGRDAMANLFILGAQQLGCELFEVKNEKVSLNLEKDVIRKIWDAYYIPYIKGYFTSHGKFRADDTKVGEILAYVGSTTSAIYFPKEVTKGEEIYPIEYLILPTPKFEGGKNYAVQQGAGMVVLKGEKKEEYASVLFLKWFTQKERNVAFSCSSGYIPVTKDAINYESFQKVVENNEECLDEITKDTLKIAFETVKDNILYTNKAFHGGVEARKILEHQLQDKAKQDREVIQSKMAEGMNREDSLKLFDTEENFEQWFAEFRQALEMAIQ